MLGIPLKAAKTVDVSNALKGYLQSAYTAEDLKNVTDIDNAVVSVNTKRNKLITLFSNRVVSSYADAITMAQDYLAFITMLGNRYPFGDHTRSSFFGIKHGKVPTVRCKFLWTDAFRSGTTIEDYELGFEKSGVLFNLASFYSLEALNHKRSSEDGIKKACQLFQSAAGVLRYMLKAPDIVRPITAVDISTETLTVFHALMMAQAQACFFERASATSGTPPTLIAKIASGVSKLYKDAMLECDKEPFKSWVNRSSCYAWARHCSFQMLCHKAAAYFWQSKASGAVDAFGEEIAHLKKAQALLNDAQRIVSGLVGPVEVARQQLASKIDVRLRAAIADNDKIYYMKVPELASLADIEPKVVVQETEFKFPDEPSDSPFHSLVPVQYQEAASELKKRLSALVSSAQKQQEDENGEAKKHLSSLNLPAALDARKPEMGLSQEIWGRVKDLQYRNGITGLSEQLTQIQQARQNAWAQLTKVKDMLTREAKTDTEMRQAYGHRWSRHPSAQITSLYLRDIDQCERFLKEGKISDAKVEGELKTHEEGIVQLSKCSREELEAQFPNIDSTSSSSSSSSTEKDKEIEKEKEREEVEEDQTTQGLRSLLKQLDSLLDKRIKTVTKFGKQIEEVNALSVIVTNKNKNVESIIVEEVKKYVDIKETMDSFSFEQKELLTQISTENDKFLRKRQNNDILSKRERVLHRINVSVEAFNKLSSNLQEGFKFYTDLLRDFLEPLRLNVSDFVTARDLESRMIMSQLTDEIATSRYKLDRKTSSSSSPTLSSSSSSSSSSPSSSSFDSSSSLSSSLSTAPKLTYSNTDEQDALSSIASSYSYANNNNTFSSSTSSSSPSSTYSYTPSAPLSISSATYATLSNTLSQLSSKPSSTLCPSSSASLSSSVISSSSKWTCPTCTYAENPASFLQCGMCATVKPNQNQNVAP
eukprot:TRINITY_DN927_c7_g1_i1.p1 TRINITY_DN927_c7_g1~~TRINITY_DN927_c7_g1_i1.p1  ORF type:complete len:941 (-),score=321.72 TRINITY_DN927_c7_g1_i1:136-2931(-)